MAHCHISLPGANLTIPTAYLAARWVPATYNFTLNVSKADGRSSTASALVTMDESNPPGLEIDPIDAKYNNVAETYLPLYGETACASGTLASYTWTIVSPAGADASSLFAASTATASTVIALGQLTSGATYSFRLTGVNGRGGTGYAQVDVVVNTPPSSGALVVTPVVGEALVTSFTGLMQNWVDDDLPLQARMEHCRRARVTCAVLRHPPRTLLVTQSRTDHTIERTSCARVSSTVEHVQLVWRLDSHLASLLGARRSVPPLLRFRSTPTRPLPNRVTSSRTSWGATTRRRARRPRRRPRSRCCRRCKRTRRSRPARCPRRRAASR